MTRSIPVRHRVVFLSFIVSGLLYLDRFVFTYVQGYVRDDLGLTARQSGWFLSAFFWSYAIAQVPAGWLSDRYGPRRMLTLYIIAWSIGTAAMGSMYGFAMLLLTRLAIGVAQAGAYPACATVVGRWVPLSARGVANAIVTFGGRLGSGITPLLTALLLMMYANRVASPAITDADLLATSHLVDQLSFAASGESLVDATEENAVRLEILRRVGSSLSREEQAAMTPQAEAYRRGFPSKDSPAKRFGLRPPDSIVPRQDKAMNDQRLQWSSALQRVISGPLIASPEQLASLPVEREAVRLVEQPSRSPEEDFRANRLILEAVLPGTLRQLYSHGWRPVMWVYGGLGLFVAAAYWMVVRDRPSEHPRVTDDELAVIEAGRPPVVATTVVDRLPARAILTSRSLWLISLFQLATNIGWTFLVLQLPKYLLEEQNCSLEERSWHSAIPLWAGWGGMLLGGWFTDWCAQRFGLRLGRMIPLASTRFLAAAAFVMMLFEPSLWMATAMFSVVALATDVGVPAVWAYNQDVGGRYIASVLGWGNMWGNIGSALSPLVIVEALERSGNWNVPFGICAAAFAFAGLCGLFIDATRPVDHAQV